MSGPGHAVYVYGVVSASEMPPIGLTGVGREPNRVRYVSCSRVAAIVSDVRRGPLGRAQDIRTHWRVLGDAIERSTVIPLRFGAIMESDAAVREDLLAPSEAHLTAQLASLHGKVQLSIRAFYREETLLRDVARRAPVAGRVGERVQQLPEPVPYYDMLRLGELIADEVARRRQRDTQVLIDHLEGLAVASHVEPRVTSERAVNVAFLVERDRVEHFTAGVQRLHAHVGDRMRIRYIGPLPPYSFAGGDEAVTADRGPLGRLP